MSMARRVCGFGVAVLSVVGGLNGAALAQPVERVTVAMSASGGAMGGGSVARRSVERYAELLGFTPEQKETALVLHEGYSESHRDMQRARRQAMEELQRSAEDTGDPSVFREKFPDIADEYAKKSRALEKGFLDDLKALCDGAQEARWSKVERLRRREVELRMGGMAGEGVDLVEVVRGLKLPETSGAELAPTLEEYETEMDAQLKARQQAREAAPRFEMGREPDLEAMNKAMEASREAGLRIKGVNERFARRIEAVLPESTQEAFRAAVRQGMYPQVYRRSPILRDIEKAMALPDLTAEQRAALGEIKSGYEREVRPVNEAWASAIEASEKDGSGGGMMTGPGGGRMMVRMDDEPAALREARTARREVDAKARGQIRKTLNEAQQAAIKPKPGEEEEGMSQEGIMIRAVR